MFTAAADVLVAIVPSDARVARRARQAGVSLLAEGAVDSYADVPAVQEAARRLLQAVGPPQPGDDGEREPLPALKAGALGFRPSTASEFIPDKWRERALSRATVRAGNGLARRSAFAQPLLERRIGAVGVVSLVCPRWPVPHSLCPFPSALQAVEGSARGGTATPTGAARSAAPYRPACMQEGDVEEAGEEEDW